MYIQRQSQGNLELEIAFDNDGIILNIDYEVIVPLVDLLLKQQMVIMSTQRR